MKQEDLTAIATAIADALQLAYLAQKNVLTMQETAKFIGVSDEELTRFVNEHKIPFYTVGTRIYFKRTELEKYLTSNRVVSDKNGYSSSTENNYNHDC